MSQSYKIRPVANSLLCVLPKVMLNVQVSVLFLNPRSWVAFSMCSETICKGLHLLLLLGGIHKELAMELGSWEVHSMLKIPVDQLRKFTGEVSPLAHG